MKVHISIEIKNLLNNERFVLWCLAPSEALNSYWKQWSKEHPDQSDNIEQTRKIVSSIRLNDYKMPQDETLELRSCILQDLRKKNKTQNTQE